LFFDFDNILFEAVYYEDIAVWVRKLTIFYFEK